MRVLFRDIETRSCALLKSAGAWRYAADRSTDVLCVGYAIDDGPVQIWTPGQPIPDEFITAARDIDWLVVAHNNAFELAIEERILVPRYDWPVIPLVRHRCTMAMALAVALPASLEKAAFALGLPFQKDRDGHRLMMQMSRPRRHHKGEDPNQIFWIEDAEHRQRLHQYCIRDVEIERALYHRLPPLSDAEQALWTLDAIINRRGFFVDRALALSARELAYKGQQAINVEMSSLTEGQITTANQVRRILAFARDRGHELQSLSKRSVSTVLANAPEHDVRRLLELRRDGARASTRKLDTLFTGIDADDRLRGALTFHGASTGRWSGKRFQPQNLKKPETADLSAAVNAIMSADVDRVRQLGAPLTIIGDISRGLICAPPGYVLIGGDFSSIESRVLSWLAGEQWKLNNYREFDRTGDPKLEPYCVTASRLLGRTITPGDEKERSLGKVADLACGFGGSVGAWRRFAPNDPRSDEEIKADITAWRDAHPATRQFWFDLERAAKRSLFTRRKITIGRLTFEPDNGTLYLTLPSNRRLAYPEARLGPGRFVGTTQISFKDNAAGGWTDTRAWYGSFIENVVQAVSRDLLAAAMQRLESAGYPVVLHVHDEILCETREEFGSTDEFLQLMTQLPDWAKGLPVAAKTWTGPRYLKTQTPRALPVPTPIVEKADGKPIVTISAQKAIAVAEVNTRDNGDEGVIGDIPLADLIGEPLANGKVVCPFHDDHTPSLVVYNDHYHCFVCGAHGDHIDWLMMAEGMDRRQAIQFLATWDGSTAERLPDNKETTTAFALQLWENARSIVGTLAEHYLAETRGINIGELPTNIDEVLRFDPCCPFGPGVRHPCLIALLRDIRTDTPSGIHRIGLTPDGRKIDRRMLGRSGAVKLWPASSQLVVGEGIETVLAAATRIPYRDSLLQPAWSAVSAGPLGNFPVLPSVERLIILVDNDAEGRAAAAQCANRWHRAGRSVVRLTPKDPGADFNDLVMRRAS
jgi:DNA polymerase